MPLSDDGGDGPTDVYMHSSDRGRSFAQMMKPLPLLGERDAKCRRLLAARRRVEHFVSKLYAGEKIESKQSNEIREEKYLLERILN